MLLALWHAWCHVTGVPRNALSAYDYVNHRAQHG